MKHVFCIASLLIFCIPSHSQVKELEAGMYVGTFAMKDLREFQERVENGTPLTESISSFPPFFVFDVSYTKMYDWGGLGFWAGYQSTGGRVQYADYSGELKTDIVIEGISVGMLYQKNLDNYFVVGRLGFTYNILVVKQSIRVFDFSDGNEDKFTSSNFPLAVVVGRRFELKDWLALSPIIFFDYSAVGSMFSHVKDEIEFPSKADWTGVRVGARIEFTTNPEKEE
ncbi:MAG: hypothetical protein ABJP45_06145 [Cyclobacteriaceae bacterium]